MLSLETLRYCVHYNKIQIHYQLSIEAYYRTIL